MHIHKTSLPVNVDGVMNEPAWLQADVAKDFWMVLPMDTSRAAVKTEVRMCYDETNIYIIAVCFKKVKGANIVESLHRDFNFQRNDNFIFFMDPFNDQTNGFSFGANAEGGQWDGTQSEGGTVDLNWDNKWTSVVKNDAEKYVFEAAIPFKTLRYKKDIKEWGINFSRNDLRTTEKSSWAPIPRQFPTASLAYTGTLIWDEPPPNAGSNISVIPYALTGYSKSYVNKIKADYKLRFGGDAKIALSSSMNLDLTVRPDFSQVEVDKQVTNLDRYELFFPEKRQFFLENADLFAKNGFADLRPFFSRRIGLGVPIDFGMRLSGKLDANWRLGLMDMETAAIDSVQLPAQNFSILTLQRKVFRRSNLQFIFINKQSVDYHPAIDSPKNVYSLYNRNAGLEYDLASSNNLWTGKAFLLKSFSPHDDGKTFAIGSNIQYSSKKWTIGILGQNVQEHYNAEVGYVPRKGYIKLNPFVLRNFFPKGGNILSHGPQLNSIYFFDEKFTSTDYENVLSYLITYRNKSTLSGLFINDFVQLLQPFDPTNTGKDSLAANTRHSWNTAGIDYVSQPRKLFTCDASVRYGGYYANGKKFSLVTDFGYRFQPYVSIALSSSYNNLSLPQPWGKINFFLIGPRIDVTFTNKLYFTTFIQYNNQQKNININARLQWRYKPASDLFVVYTDNYYSSPIFVRNRAFVIKFNYWWNL